MALYFPKRVFFEPAALDYPLGQRLYEKLQNLNIKIQLTGSHNRITSIPGNTPAEAYREAKQTLVVGVRKTLEFSTCKPSANYQLPLNTSCSGMCEYCYLATTLGKKPYLRIYVNIDEILTQANNYINQHTPEITVFEGAATSDPIPTEHLTGLLYTTIEFFGSQPQGRFRFVTKFTEVDSLLTANHGGHTRFRFSLNAQPVIARYEHGTPDMPARVAAAAKVAAAGYPLGFIIAPIFHYPGWQTDYKAMLTELDIQLPANARTGLTFELISHRFTKKAKNNILTLFPATKLPLDEENRRYKYGQFGYGKYVYPKETMKEIEDFFREHIKSFFPEAHLEYFV